MLGLDQTLRALDVNLSKELKALNLSKERPRIVPPPASFQKMVDELGLHPVLQPECPKMFTDGHLNECARRALEKYETYVQSKTGRSAIGKNMMANALSATLPRPEI